MAEAMSDYTYVGSELELFATAPRWKAYLHRQIAPYPGPEVLEVGAGIGGTTTADTSGNATGIAAMLPNITSAASNIARAYLG